MIEQPSVRAMKIIESESACRGVSVKESRMLWFFFEHRHRYSLAQIASLFDKDTEEVSEIARYALRKVEKSVKRRRKRCSR